MEVNTSSVSIVLERMKCDLQEGLPTISSLRERLQIALDVAQALQYLHAAEMIHRDVKVQNVLVSGPIKCQKKADTVKLYTPRFLRFHCNDRIDVVNKLFSI